VSLRDRRSLVTKLVFAAGLLLFAALVWRLGPGEIVARIAALGWRLPLVVLPYGVSAAFDVIGWWFAFPRDARRPPYHELFRIRLAAKAIHDTAPSASFADELLKIHLLCARGLDAASAIASVVLAKTTIMLAELIFVIVGLTLLPVEIPAAPSIYRAVWPVVLTLAIVLTGAIAWQRRGLFAPLFILKRKTGWLAGVLDQHGDTLRAVDASLRDSLTARRSRLALSVGGYLLGWSAGLLETWTILHLLGVSVSIGTVMVVEVLLLMSEALTSFVPGNVGTQEAAVVVVFRWLALPVQTALPFSLLVRCRQLTWMTIGFASLGHLALPSRATAVMGPAEDSEPPIAAA
jgi:lysylphosphatidylglycerol synthase-like protein